MKTKILVALLAVSVAGVASAAGYTNTTAAGASANSYTVALSSSPNSGSLVITTPATLKVAKCASATCNPTTNYTVSSSGLGVVIACKNTATNKYDIAPTSIEATYNFNSTKCSISTVAASATAQIVSGVTTGTTSKAGSVSLLTCADSAPVTITQINCGTGAGVTGVTTATGNNGTASTSF